MQAQGLPCSVPGAMTPFQVQVRLFCRHVHELNHVEAGLVLGGLTAANGGFNPGTELMDALFDAVISEQVAPLHPLASIACCLRVSGTVVRLVHCLSQPPL